MREHDKKRMKTSQLSEKGENSNSRSFRPSSLLANTKIPSPASSNASTVHTFTSVDDKRYPRVPTTDWDYMRRRGDSSASSRTPTFDLTRSTLRLRPDTFNTKVVSNALHDIVLYMDAIPKRAYSELQELLLTNYPPDNEKKKRWVNKWIDCRGLDLLQCAIVFNRTEILKFLLEDVQLFHQNHYPKMNPYGHLAAAIGNTKCLEALLTYRPKDYFPGSGPQHLIKLPPDIAKRFNFGQSHGMVNKHLERVLKMVKEESALAARTFGDPINEQSARFEEELKDFEKYFKEDSNKPRKRTGLYLPNLATSLPQKSTFNQSVVNTPSVVQDKLNCRKKPRKKSKVTVHNNILYDESLENGTEKTIDTSNIESAFNIRPQFSSNRERSPAPIQNTHALTKSKSQGTITAKKRLILPSIEMGVRRIKKYKEFFPVLDSKPVYFDDPIRYMGKTPLTIAAEHNQFGCVKFLLKKFYFQRNMKTEGNNSPLTLAIASNCLEAIAVLMGTSITFGDYQHAVLFSIRKMYPAALSVLLNLGKKNRTHLFGGDNLFHVLYTKCTYTPEMLPEMTRALINSGEDVNSRKTPRRYPLYSLIQSAFRVTDGRMSLYYMTCFRLLLEEKANPHFDEEKILERVKDDTLNLSRPAYTSAIHCIIENAHGSLKYFENKRWSLIIMQKFIETLEISDRTPRRTLNDALFLYMYYVSELGLNRRVLRTLLRYGANPDHMSEGRYPINAFFEDYLSFLTKFQISSTLFTCDGMLDNILILCRAMSHTCLYQAVVHFLDNHLLSTPIQALDITRKFCYHANIMIMSPRSLRHITSLYIWNRVRRNAKSVKKLPVPEALINIILP